MEAVLKTFRYKLEPNRKQRQLLSKTLDTCRELFNLALEQRRGQRIGKFEQMRQLTVLRAAFPEYKQVHVQVLQNVIKKLDHSFQNFFRAMASELREMREVLAPLCGFIQASRETHERLGTKECRMLKVYLTRPVRDSIERLLARKAGS